jgi:hypothetical protein
MAAADVLSCATHDLTDVETVELAGVLGLREGA